jgi:hypothetical protein
MVTLSLFSECQLTISCLGQTLDYVPLRSRSVQFSRQSYETNKTESAIKRRRELISILYCSMIKKVLPCAVSICALDGEKLELQAGLEVAIEQFCRIPQTHHAMSHLDLVTLVLTIRTRGDELMRHGRRAHY